MRLLPPVTIPGRVLIISVDMPSALDEGPAAAVETGERFAVRLSRVFESYNVPVTWGLDEPAASGIFPRLATRGGRHEIALRYDVTGRGEGDNLRELLTHRRRAEEMGLRVSTLIARSDPPAATLEILARHGINMVATNQSVASDGLGLVRTLRFGMWQVSASWQAPGRRGWFGAQTAAARMRRQIDRAITRNELFHIAVDGAALASSRAATRALERILRHVAQRRNQELLEVLTLCEIARQLPLSHLRPAAQSILKTQAA